MTATALASVPNRSDEEFRLRVWVGRMRDEATAQAGAWVLNQEGIRIVEKMTGSF